MPDKQSTREVSAREAVESIRSTMTNAEIMQKFKLNTSGYADLLKQLFEKGLITPADLERRGIRFKLVRRQAEPLQVQQVTAPAVEENEEFLDTLALTGLLTFKTSDQPASPPPPRKKADSPATNSPTEEEFDPSEKKKKFSISGFFKKVR